MKREITPIDLDALAQRIWRAKRNLDALMGERMPANYLGTRGARVTLARARKEIGYTIECLKTAANTIEDAREDAGTFKIANQ